MGNRLLLAAASALLVTTFGACHSAVVGPQGPAHSIGCVDTSMPLRLDRGDWLVGATADVFEVMETQVDRAPRPLGYLVAREYRQLRGGPTYRVYTVTTRNRREEVGRIDQMGRAFRHEPRRDGGFEEVPLGANTIEEGIAAIFETPRLIELRATTERRIAYEMLLERYDTSPRDGQLQVEEVLHLGTRMRDADRNRDGIIDFEEFDALDVL